MKSKVKHTVVRVGYRHYIVVNMDLSLLRFLMSKKLFSEYVDNCVKQLKEFQEPSRQLYYIHHKLFNSMVFAFDWTTIAENNHKFWSIIEREYHEYYKKYYR